MLRECPTLGYPIGEYPDLLQKHHTKKVHFSTRDSAVGCPWSVKENVPAGLVLESVLGGALNGFFFSSRHF